MNKIKAMANNRQLFHFLRMTLLLVLLIYIAFRVLLSLNFFVEEIHCGAENVIVKDSAEYLLTDAGYRYDNAAGRTNEKSFEGNYSVKLTGSSQFGMSITFDIPTEVENVEASVWCYENKPATDDSKTSFLVASIGSEFWKGTNEPSETKNGWKKFNIKFTIPNGNYQKPLVIYCWNNS